MFPSYYFDVEYVVQETIITASANQLLTRNFGNIEYIRVLDGTRVPNGIYNLELDVGTAENLKVRRRLDKWERLPA
jgi:hypothetical protein